MNNAGFPILCMEISILGIYISSGKARHEPSPSKDIFRSRRRFKSYNTRLTFPQFLQVFIHTS